MKPREFKQAREFVRNLNLKNQNEWKAYCKEKGENNLPKKPNDIPAKPERTYKGKGWVSYGDWLGTNIVATQEREYREFEEARSFVRKLNLKSEEEWLKYCKGEYSYLPKKPDDIPVAVRKVYKFKGWIGMKDWLGTEKN